MGLTGRKLKQTRISFGRTVDDERRGDNVGTKSGDDSYYRGVTYHCDD